MIVSSATGLATWRDRALLVQTYALLALLVYLIVQFVRSASARNALPSASAQAVAIAPKWWEFVLLCAAALALTMIGYRWLQPVGVPILRHDWAWPISSAQMRDLYSFVASDWNTEALGSPKAYPTLYPLFWIASGLGHLFTPKILLMLLLFLVSIVAALGMYVLTRRMLRLAWMPSCAGAFFFAFSPFVIDKLIAGHLPNLVGYALLPWVACLSLAMSGSGSWVRRLLSCIAIAILVAFSAVQIQYIVFDALLLAIISIYSSRPRVALGFTAIALALAACCHAQSFLHLISPHGRQNAEAATVEWFSELSVPLPGAFRFSGYLVQYADALYPPALEFLRPLVYAVLPIVMIFAVLGNFLRRALPWTTVAIVGLLGATGIKGPIPIPEWALTHVRALNVFREFYNFESLLCLGTAALIGIALQAMVQQKSAWRWIVVSVVIIAELIVATPFFAQNSSAKLYLWDETPAYRRFSSISSTREGERVAMLPFTSPIGLDTFKTAGNDPYWSGIGGHPTMYEWSPGPLIATADLLYRLHRTRLADNLLGAASVKWILLRKHMFSDLPSYYYGPQLFMPGWQTNEYYAAIRRDASLKYVEDNSDFTALKNDRYVPLVKLADTVACVGEPFLEVLPTRSCVRPPQHRAVVRRIVPNPDQQEYQDPQVAWVSTRKLFFAGLAFAATEDGGVATVSKASYRWRFSAPSGESAYLRCASSAGLKMYLNRVLISEAGCRSNSPDTMIWQPLIKRLNAENVLVITNSTGPSVLRELVIAPSRTMGSKGLGRVMTYSTFRPDAPNDRLAFRRENGILLSGTYRSDRPTHIIFSDSYDDWWSLVLDDDRTIQSEQVNGFENGFFVPRGRHRFMIQYVPSLLDRALGALQIFSWWILIGLLFIVTVAMKTAALPLRSARDYMPTSGKHTNPKAAH